MPSSVYSRTFQKAAQLAGSQKKLARYLRVPLSDLENWIADRDVPPISSFLKAVDFVLDETPSPSSSEPGDPPPPRDCASTGGSSVLL
jgi:hypothetical protein